MSPSEDQVRAAFEMLPQSILRKVIEERNISFKSRYTEELIDRLLEEDWTGELDALKERIAEIERERRPKSRYIVTLENINPGLESGRDANRIHHVLEMNNASFDESGLTEEGFEITSGESDETITGIHWTKSIKYELSPRNDIQRKSTLYDTGFEFDLENEVLFIDSTLPPKARSLLSELESGGIETGEIGHDGLSNEEANKRVQQFIDDVDQELRDSDLQTTIDDDFEREVIEVDLVKMLLDDLDLKDIRIGGRTDIIRHPEVKDFRDEYDSRIVRLEGNFELDNQWYEFQAGHVDGMGQVSVRKQGPVEEKPELVDASFEFLFDFYEEYFINV